jgi:hypothetical protein
MMRTLLVAALVATAGFLALETVPTLAGLADEEQAAGSFTVDLCHERDCKIAHADSLEDHDCEEDRWKFVITRVDTDRAPSSIHVTWEGGADATVGLDRARGKTAHYTTSSYTDRPVEDATARIYEAWDGNFRLGEGPCS